jgi:hypothetical protein
VVLEAAVVKLLTLKTAAVVEAEVHWHVCHSMPTI